MKKQKVNDDPGLSTPSRRNFFGSLATGAAALSAASLAPITAAAESISGQMYRPDNPDGWFKQLNGKHRMVFDVTQPHDMLPFAWPRVFLLTNEMTGGSSGKEKSVIVVLRHDAIPYAMEDRLWAKYKFGDVFKITDHVSNASAVRNPFWQPKPGEFKIPGVGEVAIGINQLQESGVLFCVCDMAITVMSGGLGEKLKQDAAEIKKDWIAGLLPGIQRVPSGVWAINRAQENGCSYCFAG